MRRYRVTLVIEFEGDVNLPEMNFRGTAVEAAELLKTLPQSEMPVAIDTSYGSVEVTEIRAPSVDPY